MKKRFLFVSFIGAITLSLCIISANAAQRQPSFFIPQKVLDKMHQPEKLPPIPKINYDNQQPQNAEQAQSQPAVTLEQQRQQNAAEAKRLADEKKIAEQRAAQERQAQEKLEKEKQLQAELERLQKIEAEKEAKIKAAEEEYLKGNSDILQNEETAKLQTKKTVSKEPQPNLQTETIPAKPQQSETAPEPKLQAMPLNNSQRTFDDIIADYKHDALGISQGKPVNNPRLRDILQDYSDERHIL